MSTSADGTAIDAEEAGYRALAREAWAEARGWFEQALAAGETAEALEGLAVAAARLGDGEAAREARKRAYWRFRLAEDRRAAARVATQLALDFRAVPRQPALAGQWLAEAGRLLADLERGPEHGWLALARGELALADGERAAAARLGEQAAAAGRALGVAELERAGLSLTERAAREPVPVPVRPAGTAVAQAVWSKLGWTAAGLQAGLTAGLRTAVQAGGAVSSWAARWRPAGRRSKRRVWVGLLMLILLVLAGSLLLVPSSTGIRGGPGPASPPRIPPTRPASTSMPAAVPTPPTPTSPTPTPPTPTTPFSTAAATMPPRAAGEPMATTLVGAGSSTSALPAPASATETPVTVQVARPNRTYIVQQGDTLKTIAQQFGVTLDDLIMANQLADPDRLQLGQPLVIPEAP